MHLITHTDLPFSLHSGGTSQFKLECAALTREDCDAAALWLLPALGKFGSVEQVPSSDPQAGWFAEAFVPHVDLLSCVVLIVDDVLTSGGSMQEQRGGRLAVGAVIVARGPLPSWVQALLELNPRCRNL